MRRHHRPGVFRLNARALALAVFCAGLLSAATFHHLSPRYSTHATAPIRVSPATSRDVQAPDSRAAPSLPARIDVDATRTGPANPELLERIRAAIEPPVAPPASAPATNSAAPAERGQVLRWARLRSDSTRVYGGNAEPAEGLDVYAVRGLHGATVCISNRRPAEAAVQLRVRLLKAPYKIEQLIFRPATVKEAGTTATMLPQAAPPADGPAEWLLTRLKGRDLPSAETVSIPLTVVRPGSLVLVRFTDAAYESRCALNEFREQLRTLPRTSGELARRLQTIFQGSGSCERAISATCSLSADRRRSDIHRYLLVLGQAYSLHLNFHFNDSAQSQTGVKFRAALDRLNDALADTSATLMGLVPGITLSTEPPAEVLTVAARQDAGAPQGGEAIHTAYATVTLSNQGSRPADHVKVGLDQSALPAGVTCEPAEPALFGPVAPAQTVRATYQLRWKGRAENPLGAFTGDVSYFTAGAPAHLHPRTW